MTWRTVKIEIMRVAARVESHQCCEHAPLAGGQSVLRTTLEHRSAAVRQPDGSRGRDGVR